ncbi:S-protein homolog 5-like [Durio zibethinus]|uniref:S-protein homolog n=1 Tax=Durio zibethinus TaxID=66656 RepID=A0A6P5Y4S0_DURZI|nr:S-protein homolog 5-like [Durio zibethinus]
MNPSSQNLLLISCLLSLTLLFIASEAIFLPRKAHVIISNDLNTGSDLTIHCKSYDDDLGVWVLPPNKDYEFTFRPIILGSTLYYCSMQWNGGFHWFDIYDQKRDRPLCSRCLWKVRPNGPCMFNYETTNYDICYPWKEDA